jgi:cytochrome c
MGKLICGVVLSVCALAVPPPPSAAKGGAKNTMALSQGKEVFQQCAGCHPIVGKQAGAGPNLKGLYKKPRLKSGVKTNDASIRGIIEQGGNGMPGYAEILTKEERSNLLAYLKTI